MNQLKLSSQGGHIAQKIHSSSLPPQCGYTHTCTQMYTHMCTHIAEGRFHLMVFLQQNSPVLGFSSPIFFSPPLSPPPTLEAGLCQRAEEASELVEESPQQHGTESYPRRSSRAWLLVLAQVKQHEDFPHSPISCDFELPFLPKQAHTAGLCTLLSCVFPFLSTGSEMLNANLFTCFR